MTKSSLIPIFKLCNATSALMTAILLLLLCDTIHAQNSFGYTVHNRNDVFGAGLQYESKIRNVSVAGFDLSDRVNFNLSFTSTTLDSITLLTLDISDSRRPKLIHRHIETDDINFLGFELGYDFLFSRSILRTDSRLYTGLGVNWYGFFPVDTKYALPMQSELHSRIVSGIQYQLNPSYFLTMELQYRFNLWNHYYDYIRDYYYYVFKDNEDYFAKITHFSPLQIVLGFSL